MADAPVEEPEPTALKRFAAYLGQYRDVIVLLLFFLGGFFYLDRTFPKHEDLARESNKLTAELTRHNEGLVADITRLQCLVDSYMQLTQLQTNTLNTDARRAELLTLIKTGALTPAMTADMETEIDVLKNRSLSNVSQMTVIRQKLERNECASPRSA